MPEVFNRGRRGPLAARRHRDQLSRCFEVLVTDLWSGIGDSGSDRTKLRRRRPADYGAVVVGEGAVVGERTHLGHTVGVWGLANLDLVFPSRNSTAWGPDQSFRRRGGILGIDKYRIRI